MTNLFGKTWELAVDYDGLPEGTRFTVHKIDFNPLMAAHQQNTTTGIYATLEDGTVRHWNKPNDGLLIREVESPTQEVQK